MDLLEEYKELIKENDFKSSIFKLVYNGGHVEDLELVEYSIRRECQPAFEMGSSVERHIPSRRIEIRFSTIRPVENPPSVRSIIIYDNIYSACHCIWDTTYTNTTGTEISYIYEYAYITQKYNNAAEELI